MVPHFRRRCNYFKNFLRGADHQDGIGFTGVIDELAHQSPHVLAAARVGVDVSWSQFYLYRQNFTGRSFMLELIPPLLLWEQELNLRSIPAVVQGRFFVPEEHVLQEPIAAPNYKRPLVNKPNVPRPYSVVKRSLKYSSSSTHWFSSCSLTSTSVSAFRPRRMTATT